MLLQFNFKNFKSFRDDVSLDLTATKITEFNDHVVELGNERVLPVAAIYGANASGKSNVHEAFRYMLRYVMESVMYGGELDSRKTSRPFIKPTPFLLEEKNSKEESVFEVYFYDERQAREYNYGFAIDQEGVAEEWLRYTTKSARGKFKDILHRIGTELSMPKIQAKHRENLKIALQKETLAVSLGAKLRIPELMNVWKWFLKNETADFGQPVENYVLSSQLPDDFVEDEEVRKDVVRYFESFDPSIKGFNIEAVETENEDEKSYKIEALHKMIDSDQLKGIPLKRESAGTLKMFALYPMLHEVLTNGGVFFVDELNARLHPLLIRALIVSFTNPENNPVHAQLIFTSHDAFQLNSGVLRRDEIWFVEKDDKGISNLFSLVDYFDQDGDKIRKDENFERNYLLGKYGAIPSMELFDMTKEGN